MAETIRIDELKNGIKIVQDSAGFCYGIDAILLADFAKAGDGDFVVDLCAGNAVVPVLMAAAGKGKKFTAVEVQKESVDLAIQTVAVNGMENKVEIVEGDLRAASRIFSKACAEVVTCNPPYMTVEQGTVSGNRRRAVARQEILCSLEDVVGAAAYILKQNGSFYMIHRANRLDDVFVELEKGGFAVKSVRLVYPDDSNEATMVLVKAVKGAGKGLRVEKPLFVYEREGVYSAEMQEIRGQILGQ